MGVMTAEQQPQERREPLGGKGSLAGAAAEPSTWLAGDAAAETVLWDGSHLAAP